MRNILVVVSLLSACSSRTQLMLGVITDLRAPSALDEVRMTVERDGVVQLEHEWNIPGVPGASFVLPGSFGLYSPDGTEHRVSVNVTGWLRGVQQVQRKSLVSFVRGQTLFLRMGLVAGCVNRSDCGAEETCVEGLCKSWLVDSRRLPTYREELVDHIECGSARYLNTGTGDDMARISGACDGTDLCQEATCFQPMPNDDLILPPDLAAPVDLATPPSDDMFPPDDMTMPAPGWVTMAAPSPANLYSVWTTSDGTAIFVVGAGGAIASLDLSGGPPAATAWVIEPSGISDDLYGVYGTSPSDVWAVGDNGATLHRDDTGTWTSFTGASGNLRGVTIDGNTSDVIAVGYDPGNNKSLVYYHAGGMWTETSSGAYPPFRAVGGIAPDLFAVGDSLATLYLYNVDLMLQPTTPAGNLVGVNFVGGRGAAIASNGNIYGGDGRTAFALEATVPTNLSAVWGAHATAFYASGPTGTVYFSDTPGTWTAQWTGALDGLNAVAGSPFGVYAVGDNGAIVFNPNVPPPAAGPPDAGVDMADLADLAGTD